MNRDILSEVHKEILAELRLMLSKDIAEGVAERITQRVRETWGGDKHYVKAPSKRRRNQGIILDWLEMRKHGYDDRRLLAKKYEVHPATINRVITKYLRNRHSSTEDIAPENWVL